MNRITVVALLLALTACAAGRKQLGEVRITTDTPLTPAQQFDSSTFRVEEGRLMLTAPWTGFDGTLNDQGCVEISETGRHGLAVFCPRGAQENGVQVYKMTAGQAVFGVRVMDDNVIRCEAAPYQADVQVAPGDVTAELRRHPELLCAAFAVNSFPASKDTDDSTAEYRDRKYRLTASR